MFKLIFQLLTILLISSAVTDSAKLRKTPKVYNALITTDEELTPSKAYPLIQPVFQPIPIFSPLYPVSYADQYLPSNINHNSNNNIKNEEKSPLKVRIIDIQGVVFEANFIFFQTVEVPIPQEVNNAAEGAVEKQQSPIPLNEFGLPPSLIPLKNYPAYPYNLPFFYNSYGNYQSIQYPVLPPLDFYNPQQNRQLPPIDAPMFEVKPSTRNINAVPQEKSTPQQLIPQSPISTDSIKNYANKNAEIPDVAIPPLPVKYQ